MPGLSIRFAAPERPRRMSPSPPAVSLFRPEALAEQSSQFLGSVRIASSPRGIAVALLAVALTVAAVAFAVLGQATRKVRVHGVLMPQGGLLQVSAPQPARVREIRVAEGEPVAPGQVLAVLQLDGATDQGDTGPLLQASLRARREALQAEGRSLQAQARQREQSLADRQRSLQLDLAQAEGELEATARRVRLAESSLARDQGLAAQGFLSAAQVQSRHEDLLDLQVRERGVRRNAEGLRREAASVQAEVQANLLQAATQQAQIERAQAALDQEQTELRARSLLYLTAPAAATVGVLPLAVGHGVQAGQTVIGLQPSTSASAPSSLHAELYAPSRTSGFVEPGQPVWVRLHAYPYQKFGMVPGEVAQVSRTPVLPHDLPSGMAQALLGAAQAQEPLYRITVRLKAHELQAWGRARTLKPGMTLEADVVQDRRAVWEWVLEPLLAAGQRWKVSTVQADRSEREARSAHDAR